MSSSHAIRAASWLTFAALPLAHASTHALWREAQTAALSRMEQMHAWWNTCDTSSCLSSHQLRPAPSPTDTILSLLQHLTNPLAAPTYAHQRHIINYIKRRWPYPVEDGVQEMVLHVEFDMEIQRGDYVRAAQVADEIYALRPSKLINFKHYALASFVSIRISFYLALSSRCSLFLALLNIVDECMERMERTIAARCINFCTTIIGQGRAQRLDVTSSANHTSISRSSTTSPLALVGLPILLRALNLARSLHAHLAEAELMVAIAQIHFDLGQWFECERCLLHQWPTLIHHDAHAHANTGMAGKDKDGKPITDHESIMDIDDSSCHASSSSSPIRHLQYRTHLLLAHVSLARIHGTTPNGDLNKATHILDVPPSQLIHRAIQHLQQACKYADTSSQLIESYYLLARCYDRLHMRAERNKYASLFCALNQPAMI